MKGSTKHIICLLLLHFTLCGYAIDAQWQSDEELNSITTVKKSFDDEEFDRLKREVELVEELSKKKLKQDSSEFGKGYGVEHGHDYQIIKYDSITGEVTVTDSLRSSGSSFTDDGIRRNSTDDQRRSINERRERKKRTENQGQHAERGKRSTSEPKRRRNNETHTSTGFGGDFGSFFLIVLLALAIGVIIYILLVKKPIEGASRTINYVQDIDPTTVQLSELEIKIVEAESENDYRIAVRYYFIWVLKELSDSNSITWKKKKTNHHYLSETLGKPFYLGFHKIVNLFEYIWYGKYILSEKEYAVVKKDFLQFIKQLKGDE